MHTPSITSPRVVSILGSTGSIGKNAVNVIQRNPEIFRIKALTGFRQAETLIAQARALKPEYVVIGDETQRAYVQAQLSDLPIEILGGQQALLDVAALPTDVTLAAIVGMGGLDATWSALKGTRQLAIANKESIVASGPLLLEEAQKRGVKVVPVDSEHNALFQLENGVLPQEIKQYIITASGGPFREHTVEALQDVTVEQALRHPNWSMGVKNTIDSATLINKGLELIEASYLFKIPSAQLEAWIHPQSIVHAIIELKDGSYLMQANRPDMKGAIAYALSWPSRLEEVLAPMSLTEISSLTFEPIDSKKFPAVQLARNCLEEGLWATISYNAANEEAVDAFTQGRISFLGVTSVVQEVVAAMKAQNVTSLEEVKALNQMAKERAQEMINKIQTYNNGGRQWMRS